MRVLGIDPGSTVTGFGVVEKSRGRIRYVASGCIKPGKDTTHEARLVAIYEGLVAALEAHQPDQVSIEAIFMHKSAASALKLGQARGVALLAAAQRGFVPVPYNAATVKRSLGLRGAGDKASVARMVEMLLGVQIEGPADVTDALAIAITHCAHHRKTP